MKMKHLCTGFMAMASVAAFSAAQAETQLPTLNGELNVAIIDESAGNDLQFQAASATVGLKGMYVPTETKAFKMIYEFELDATSAINSSEDDDDVEVSEAALVFLTQVGTIITSAKGTSGAHTDLYGPVDKFEIFGADNSSVYTQPSSGAGVLAYKTPSFGGFYISVANVNIGDSMDDNDESMDSYGGRLMYKNQVGPGKLAAGVGYSVTSENVTGIDELKRYTYSFEYVLDAFNVGVVYEDNVHFAGDFTVLGVVAQASLPMGLTLTGGYYMQDDAREGTVAVANISYTITEQIYMYLEYADYSDMTDDGYTALGLSYSF